jgi:DNA-binding NtrC family response regulator
MHTSDKRVVLVVDDEKNMRALINKALRDKDTDIVEAETAEQALEYVKNNDVDIVISDVILPNMNGMELFFELRKIDPFLQILLITGYPTWSGITEMMSAGACDFLMKPFDIKELQTIVNGTYLRIARWKFLKREMGR